MYALKVCCCGADVSFNWSFVWIQDNFSRFCDRNLHYSFVWQIPRSSIHSAHSFEYETRGPKQIDQSSKIVAIEMSYSISYFFSLSREMFFNINNIEMNRFLCALYNGASYKDRIRGRRMI